MLRACTRETGFGHPAHAVCGCVVKAALGLDQHVQAHQQSKRVLRAIVVDDRLIDDQCAAGRQRLVRLADKHPLFVQAPVVQDVPQDDHISLREVVREEVAAYELQSSLHAVVLDEILEHGRDLGQVETDAREVWVGERDLHSEVAFGRPNICEGRMLTLGELLRDRQVGSVAKARHRREKLLQAGWIGVERFEERRLPGRRRRSEAGPFATLG